MGQTLERLLTEWRDHLDAHTLPEAENLIHMLMLEIAGKEEVIQVLEEDIQYYKSIGQLLINKLEKPHPKTGL